MVLRYHCSPINLPPKLFSISVAVLDNFFAVSTGN